MVCFCERYFWSIIKEKAEVLLLTSGHVTIEIPVSQLLSRLLLAKSTSLMGLEGDILFNSMHLLCIHLNCFFLMITSVTPSCHCLQASHWTELVAKGKCLWSWLYSLRSELWVSYQETRMVLNQRIILLSLNGRCWKQFQHRDQVLSPREKVHTQNFLLNYRAKVYFIFALSFYW